jgi:hypothetical protein
MTDSGSRGARAARRSAPGLRLARQQGGQPDEEVAADRVGAGVGVDPRVGTEMPGQGVARPGPATMLVATAWLGATAGLSSRRGRTS